MILSPDDVFCVDNSWLPSIPRTLSERQTNQDGSDDDAQHERDLIESALAQSRGRISRPSGAAARLGFPSSTFNSRIEKLKIRKSRFKRIDGISAFAEFGEIHTFPSSSFPHVFNYFRMAFCVHSLRMHAFTRGLPERRGNDMQNRSTDRPPRFRSAFHKRPSSASAHEHDRRVHCPGNRSCDS